MTKNILSLLIFIIASVSGVYGQADTRGSVNIGLVYPLSTNGFRAWHCNNYFSANAIAGISRSEQAFCVAGVSNTVRDSAKGLIAAGVVNVVGGTVQGIELAGVVNKAGNVTGMQASGFLNLCNNINGLQTAGFGNIARGNVQGVQYAGFFNKAKNANAQFGGFVNVADNIKGVQMAGYINIAKGDVEGAQIAGFSNQAHNVHAQVSGFINRANNVEGIQAAGFINVAHKVKGVQVSGFINIADSSDYPIGIINLIKKGEKAIGVNVDETGTTMATFRSGGRIMYGMIGAGVNNYKSNGLYAVGAGIGAHLPFTKYFRVNVEAAINTLAGFDGKYFLNTGIRVFPSVRVARVEVFAGPSMNFNSYSRSLSLPVTSTTIWSDQYYGRKQDVHLGFIGGLQMHISEGKSKGKS